MIAKNQWSLLETSHFDNEVDIYVFIMEAFEKVNSSEQEWSHAVSGTFSKISFWPMESRK